MVQFPEYRFAYLCIQYAMTESLPPGYPIRPPRDHWICAPTPGFSQLVAAFFAMRLLGIHHEPVFA